MSHYPIWLDLRGKPCLVVGGGQVAERKIASLMDAHADITVVSPEMTWKIKEWIREYKLKGIFASYDSQYSISAFLVIAATDSAAVNQQVGTDAARQGQLFNQVDDPETSSFIVPAVVRRGKLSIAISTSGASPALSSEIKQKLERAFGDEYEVYVDFLGELRQRVQAKIKDPELRRNKLKQVLELDLLAAIRDGSFDKKLWFAQILGDG